MGSLVKAFSVCGVTGFVGLFWEGQMCVKLVMDRVKWTLGKRDYDGLGILKGKSGMDVAAAALIVLQCCVLSSLSFATTWRRGKYKHKMRFRRQGLKGR